VLWVKGSGGDIGTMKLDGFATLYLDKLLSLAPRYHGPQDEDQMVGLYAHCAFNLNSRAASIDTPLHALVDRPHIDHMHPDAVIGIAASSDSRALTQQIYGDEIGWLPWIRPGFELALQLKQFADSHPHARGVVLEAHGLFTWGRLPKPATTPPSKSSTAPLSGSTRMAIGTCLRSWPPRWRPCPGRGASRLRGAHATHPRTDLGRGAQDRPFR
jgi:rhamnose utilization protein RhaD (predicted bifunctional aldolase and dehydrogenase)